jgi:glutaredoxin
MQPGASRRVVQLSLLAALVGVGAAMWTSVAAEWRKRDEHDVRKVTGEHGVVVFVAEWCGYCKRLERWLDRSGVPYRALDVEQSDAAMYGQEAVVGRYAGVPTTVIGSDVFQGLATEALRERLGEAGYTMRGNP